MSGDATVKSIYPTDVIRIALAFILLFTVWTHAHWSVALCLILLAIAEEMRYIERRREREMTDRTIERLKAAGVIKTDGQ
jgi:hypothetical protein